MTPLHDFGEGMTGVRPKSLIMSYPAPSVPQQNRASHFRAKYLDRTNAFLAVSWRMALRSSKFLCQLRPGLANCSRDRQREGQAYLSAHDVQLAG
jgi:hypothetical protein